MRKNFVIVAAFFTILAAAGIAWWAYQIQTPPTHGVVQTVQRMPAAGVPTKDTTNLRAGQQFTYRDFIGVIDTVTSDSRCPTDAVCVWAGTVKVQTQLQAGKAHETLELELGKPYNFYGYLVTLVDVSPKKNTKVTVAPSDYRFTVSVTDTPYDQL